MKVKFSNDCLCSTTRKEIRGTGAKMQWTVQKVGGEEAKIVLFTTGCEEAQEGTGSRFTCIHYFHNAHTTPCLPRKILHKHCFQLLLGGL